MPKHTRAGQDEDNVETWFIEKDGVRARIDLCEHHSAQIKNLFEIAVANMPSSQELPAVTKTAIERRFRND